MSGESEMLRLPEVVAMTRLSKPTIYCYIRDGIFPRQIRLGPNVVAWSRAEVLGWLNERADAREAA
jgi:prophage regulatory protein